MNCQALNTRAERKHFIQRSSHQSTMVAKIKKVSPAPAAPKKISKENGIAKKGKKPKNSAKESSVKEKAAPVKAKDSTVKEKAAPVKSAPASKHIVFDDDDKPVVATAKKTPKKSSKENARDIGKRWYEEFDKYNLNAELEELKEAEISELTEKCRKNYENLLPSFEKKNPSDGKWLRTALQKGTSKDRANAGALLVQTNPLANLQTLETLIGFTKTTNKMSTDSVDVTTDLFINALLPPTRKLISLPLRGADWKALRKNQQIDEATRDKIYALWHFEAALKEQYFEFLRNVQAAIQGSQDANKNQAIIYAAKLLSYSPEKEQLLLTMLVNKLGDPSNKVAAKALHHLTEVAFKHPAMCTVIASETEKFLFRNNITEHAQHFALCFLAQLTPHGNVDVCTKLVNICFSFFKILIARGAINNKTMQAILRCLKRAIVDVVKANDETPGTDAGFMSKDTQDTIYRLVHFADIHISLQTLALLLQIITAVTNRQQHDRFYNALYKKILDPNLGTCGTASAALFLHIVHRAIHIDTNKARAQAFIKRLLQVALHYPPQMACGCLIVVNKLVKARHELNKFVLPQASVGRAIDEQPQDETSEADAEVANEEGETAGDQKPQLKTKRNDNEQMYNAFHRVPTYAGAEYALRTELVALSRHFHPSVQVFAKNLIDNAHIKFYGDPLKDFSLTQFLERFAFKNPKKSDANKSESLVQSIHNKSYTPHGSRGLPVNQLTTTNCTEDERFIFEFLSKKREKREAFKGVDASGDVDDDEFDAYLDSLGGKKKKKEGDEDEEDEEFDFMGDFGEEFQEAAKGTKKTHKSGAEDADENDWDSDGGEEDDGSDNESGGELDEDEDMDSDGGSVSLDGEEDESGSDIFEDDDDEDDDDEEVIDGDSDGEVSDPDEPKAKKSKSLSSKEFQRKLKNTDNMESLFAAADDFSEMLEETSKSSKHGTLGEIFNQDKSSEKQMEWEQNRLKKRGGAFKRGKPASKPKPKRHRSQGQKARGEATKQKKSAGGKRK